VPGPRDHAADHMMRQPSASRHVHSRHQQHQQRQQETQQQQEQHQQHHQRQITEESPRGDVRLPPRHTATPVRAVASQVPVDPAPTAAAIIPAGIQEIVRVTTPPSCSTPGYCPLCMEEQQIVFVATCCFHSICQDCAVAWVQKQVTKSAAPSARMRIAGERLPATCPHCSAPALLLNLHQSTIAARTYDDSPATAAAAARQKHRAAIPEHSPLRVGDSFEDMHRKMVRFAATMETIGEQQTVTDPPAEVPETEEAAISREGDAAVPESKDDAVTPPKAGRRSPPNPEDVTPLRHHPLAILTASVSSGQLTPDPADFAAASPSPTVKRAGAVSPDEQRAGQGEKTAATPAHDAAALISAAGTPPEVSGGLAMVLSDEAVHASATPLLAQHQRPTPRELFQENDEEAVPQWGPPSDQCALLL
jgi:hypothetical protein